MKTLVYGAGTLGLLYAHRLFTAGKDVTLLSRGEQYAFVREHGVVLVNEFTAEREVAAAPVVETLSADDEYDLVVVLIRKNLLDPVFETLSLCSRIRNILFMGNNALGFGSYLRQLPAEKMLFGFPGAGGCRKQGVAHYVDSEKPNGKRMPITIGEIDGERRDRTRQIQTLFESSGVPADVVPDIDGWLKYHVAMVSPLANALRSHACVNYALAADREMLRLMVRACKEGGNVLNALGHTRRQPFKWNLFYWLPEALSARVFSGMLNSRFAEIAFAQHAAAASDEMRCLADELQTLIDQSSLATPSIDKLRSAT